MTVRPYHFHLKKISGKQQALLEAISLPESFHAAIRKVLHKHLGPQVLYYLAASDTASQEQFCKHLPDPCPVIVLGLHPLKEKAFVQIDPILAGRVVDKMLGGEGNESTEFRSLTDSEQGVLEFLALELLQQMHQMAPSCHFRLDYFAQHPKELQRWVDPETSAFVLHINVTLWQHAGFIRLCLPQALVSSGLAAQGLLGRGILSPQELREKALAAGAVRVGLWGELGESVISHGDLQGLEAGDVLLFDRTGLATSSGGIRGEVILRVGQGESGGFAAQWKGMKEKGHCVVKELILGEAYAEEK